MTSRVPTAVIGIGNEYRGDDAAGLAVARSLADTDDVVVLELPGEGSEIIEALERFDRAFLVDASRSDSEPGRIREFDVSTEPLPVRFFNYSTHAFGLAEAIEVARALGRLPSTVRVFGIEGQSFAAGAELSAAVRESIHQVEQRIRVLLDDR